MRAVGKMAKSQMSIRLYSHITQAAKLGQSMSFLFLLGNEYNFNMGSGKY